MCVCGLICERLFLGVLFKNCPFWATWQSPIFYNWPNFPLKTFLSSHNLQGSIESCHTNFTSTKFFIFSAFCAQQFRDLVISEVAHGKMKVVCNGVSSRILPGLKDAYVRRFNRTPVGPHPVGSFEVRYIPFVLPPSFFTTCITLQPQQL